ncbi:MAG TPA: response regulator, partial [Acidimicrobiales bacterium]
ATAGQPTAVVREEPAPPHDRRGGETILVVEDEDALRELVRLFLIRDGYQVLTAADGGEALEVAASYAGTIDLLLTDLIMPLMLGPDLAERLSPLRPGLRVVYMSGGSLDEGDTLLRKPFSEQALLGLVRTVLDQA